MQPGQQNQQQQGGGGGGSWSSTIFKMIMVYTVFQFFTGGGKSRPVTDPSTGAVLAPHHNAWPPGQPIVCKAIGKFKNSNQIDINVCLFDIRTSMYTFQCLQRHLIGMIQMHWYGRII